MSWRILYIEDAMSVKLYLDNIKIIKGNDEITIPLSDIHTLILDSQQVSITVPLINKCSEYNINFIVCSIEHMPKSIINPFSGNYHYPLMLKKQIAWNEEMKKQLHKRIIQNKINNQIDALKFFNKDKGVIEKIYQFMEEVQDGDVTNREGLAAKMYFRELFGNSFKRFDEDPINIGLNYGYAILRSQISKTIISKGLNTSLGIFHKGAENTFNLSDDIIEVFRPVVDIYVYENMRDAIFLSRDNRLGLIKQTTKNVYINSTSQSIFNAISMYLDKIIKVFDTNDIEFYENVYLENDL